MYNGHNGSHWNGSTNGQHLFHICSIQPVGTGTEVRLPSLRPVIQAAPHRGAVTSAGVPHEVVARFLGKSFCREELESLRVRFLGNGTLVYRWQGQAYFLAPEER